MTAPTPENPSQIPFNEAAIQRATDSINSVLMKLTEEGVHPAHVTAWLMHVTGCALHQSGYDIGRDAPLLNQTAVGRVIMSGYNASAVQILIDTSRSVM